MKKQSILFSGRRAILFWSILIPLFRALIITPLLQILTPNLNLASSVPYTLLFFLSDLLTLTAFFALIALGIHAIYTNRGSDALLALACQCASLIFIGVLLQALIYLLLAFLDETFPGSSFSLCNYSLNGLLTGGLSTALMQGFFGILLLLAVLLLSFAAAYLLHGRAQVRHIHTDDAAIADAEEKQSPVRPAILAVTVIFFAGNLINDLFETFATLIEFSFHVRLSYLPGLISPYILLLIYTVLGYYVLTLITTRAAQAARAINSSRKGSATRK